MSTLRSSTNEIKSSSKNRQLISHSNKKKWLYFYRFKPEYNEFKIMCKVKSRLESRFKTNFKNIYDQHKINEK